MTSTGRRATIADVARAAEVSTSTASVVFSGKVNVAAATREKVLAAAERLGYTGPDPRAASLRTGRSGIVGVMLGGDLRHAFLDPVTTAVMDGLTDALSEVSAGLLLLRDDPHGDGAPSLTRTPLDAVVLIGCSPGSRAVVGPARRRGLPVVVIDADAGDGVPQVVLDDRAASARLARHLRRLGHERAAVVTLPLDATRRRGALTPEREPTASIDVTRLRLEGFREVYPAAPGISAAASLVDEGLIAGRALLTDSDGALRPDRPTAVMAQSDLLAVGIIRAAEEAGLRIPDDLSVVGFDGIAADGLGARELTTAVQPALEKGRAAGELILRMLRGEASRSVHLRCAVREGTTTGAPPAPTGPVG